jgi:hypothetical protein
MSAPKSLNFNSILLFITLGVMGWAGTTLESVRREVDVIKIQLSDYKQSSDDKLAVIKSDSARHETMLGEIRIELSRLHRSAPPKQTNP